MSSDVTSVPTAGAPNQGTDAKGPRERPLSVVLATGGLVVAALYFLIPIWWLVVASSKSQATLVTTNGLWFAQPFQLFSNVSNLFAFRDGLYVRWLLNSVGYAVLGAGFGTLFAVMAGYALAKYVFRGRELVFNLILGGVLVPATALALPLFLMFSQVGLVNTYWAVFLPSLVSPFGVYLARIYAAASVPDPLLEAARLDGASEFRAFFVIALRLMKPALVTIFLFQFVVIWNNFFLPLVMLSNERLFPITLGLYTWNSSINQAPELRLFVIVGSMVSILPLLIAFLGLQRFWQSGLSAGGVK
jgi:multiple sugar transport system permease protein